MPRFRVNQRVGIKLTTNEEEETRRDEPAAVSLKPPSSIATEGRVGRGRGGRG